ncbi:MAG: ABC transporter permease [Verrucomicrobia bacterium]|jgi:ABC-type transport system involved in multi-copper enzyme maturation permease subunit|nr:ABC transporter permease [Verrucomicrobiota bacterium]
MNRIFAVAEVVIRELIRRKDFYVLFVLTAAITLLMGSITFFNEDTIARYVKEICLLLIWLATLVITVTTAGRQLPAEKESRTIFPLLAKPISRTEVLLGKFVGCWLAVGFTLIVFYLFFGVISVAREHELPLVNYLQAIWLHWLMLGIVGALALVGSLLLTPAANVSIVILGVLGIWTVGEFLNQLAARTGGLVGWVTYAVYFAIPHLEIFDLRERIIHGWEPVAWGAMGLATLYAAVYMAMLLTLAALLFRRKPLN